MPAGKGRYTIGGKGTHGCEGYPVVGGEGKVHGCHATEEAARAQQAAIYASEADSEKSMENCCPDESLDKQAPCWDGYVQRGMKPGDNGKMVPNCVPVAKADDLYEDSDDVVYETDSVAKADGYSPPAGARAAARRAIKFKEDGKANGAGTAVGWTRAGQLARGETLSLSTVKRMYSYFSRHEVDKKGKDWGNTANPSNGYIMWLAWGGDAGFSWSRGIVQREMDKALFSDFGKDYTKSTKIVDIKQHFCYNIIEGTNGSPIAEVVVTLQPSQHHSTIFTGGFWSVGVAVISSPFQGEDRGFESHTDCDSIKSMLQYIYGVNYEVLYTAIALAIQSGVLMAQSQSPAEYLI